MEVSKYRLPRDVTNQQKKYSKRTSILFHQVARSAPWSSETTISSLSVGGTTFNPERGQWRQHLLSDIGDRIHNIIDGPNGRVKAGIQERNVCVLQRYQTLTRSLLDRSIQCDCRLKATVSEYGSSICPSLAPYVYVLSNGVHFSQRLFSSSTTSSNCSANLATSALLGCCNGLLAYPPY